MQPKCTSLKIHTQLSRLTNCQKTLIGSDCISLRKLKLFVSILALVFFWPLLIIERVVRAVPARLIIP